MLAPSMEPGVSGPSLRTPRHLNGHAIAAKIAGSNIVSTGDGSPPVRCQEPQNQCLPYQLLEISDTYTLCSVVRVDCTCMKRRKGKYNAPGALREGYNPLEHL